MQNIFFLLITCKNKNLNILSLIKHISLYFDFPGGSDGKASVPQCGRPGFDPWVGKFPGEGNGNPLQYSCLENPMDRGAWCPWGRKELDMT